MSRDAQSAQGNALATLKLLGRPTNGTTARIMVNGAVVGSGTADASGLLVWRISRFTRGPEMPEGMTGERRCLESDQARK